MHYSRIGEILAEDPKIKDIELLLSNRRKLGFVVVDGCSRQGKTQLFFTLKVLRAFFN